MILVLQLWVSIRDKLTVLSLKLESSNLGQCKARWQDAVCMKNVCAMSRLCVQSFIQIHHPQPWPYPCKCKNYLWPCNRIGYLTIYVNQNAMTPHAVPTNNLFDMNNFIEFCNNNYNNNWNNISLLVLKIVIQNKIQNLFFNRILFDLYGNILLCSSLYFIFILIRLEHFVNFTKTFCTEITISGTVQMFFLNSCVESTSSRSVFRAEHQCFQFFSSDKM